MELDIACIWHYVQQVLCLAAKSQSCSMQPFLIHGPSGLTFQRSCQHAARSFHKIIRGICAAGEAVGNLRAMEYASWPVALEAGVCGVCVHLRSHELMRAVGLLSGDLSESSKHGTRSTCTHIMKSPTMRRACTARAWAAGYNASSTYLTVNRCWCLTILPWRLCSMLHAL